MLIAYWSIVSDHVAIARRGREGAERGEEVVVYLVFLRDVARVKRKYMIFSQGWLFAGVEFELLGENRVV